ncbi:MAG: Cof-type HAD-IIB family hydrolase [Clostridium sp.]|nr:Cof-type HAD-IIB family hydrolase [Clostridium sp.]
MTETQDRKPLFITDLDGTLLNSESRVSDRSAAILNDLLGRGAMITIATARTPATVDRLMEGIGWRLPMIVMTGAALWDPRLKRYADVRYVDPALTARIMEVCETSRISPFVYTLAPGSHVLDMTHYGPMTRREENFAAERSRLPLKRFHCAAGRCGTPPDNTVLFFATGPAEQIMACAGQLRRTTPCSISAYRDIFNRETALLEIFAPGVSKGAAVDRLRTVTGATSVTVFGDNLNDLEMMRCADCAVAVANAFDEVRRAADRVIEANILDAVPRYISSRLG